MDVMKIGTELLMSKLGSSQNSEGISGALGQLLGGDGGNFDISGLVSKMMSNNDLQGLVGSWLGDGDNDSISADMITELFGSDKLSEFASTLGVDQGAAAEGLSEAIPQMVDKGSTGGSLLGAVGGVDGIADLAKKFF